MDIEIVTEGLQFPEGPIALSDGSVLLVEIRRGTLTKVAPDGRTEVVAETGGGPNGAAIGPDGAVYLCNNGGFEWADLPGGLSVPHHAAADYSSGSIQRVDLKTGTVTTLYTQCDGIPLRGPNDIVFDREGGFWFTDYGKSNEEYQQFGALCYALADGSHISRQRAPLTWPNGVGLSPDGGTVYVSETWTARLWAYDVERPGRLAPQTDPFRPGRLLKTMPDYTPFDSLAVEADGRVCVATCLNGGITVHAHDGSVDHVAIPDPVTTNLCFGGADMRDVWVTGSGTGRLFRLRWPRPGLRLEYNA